MEICYYGKGVEIMGSDRKGLVRLLSDYVRMKVAAPKSDLSDLPITDEKNSLNRQLEASDIHSVSQLNEFRTIAEDRETQYSSYDEMSTDSVIAAALEMYADDATSYDEQGRIIWVESDSDEIARAANRLLDILEIPERAWKHIHQACKYGDYYLKLYRVGELEDDDVVSNQLKSSSHTVHIVNDHKDKGKLSYEEYVEDIEDPATVFDLKKRGKTAGFIEVARENKSTLSIMGGVNQTYSLSDVTVYPPDKIIHITLGETLSRNPETVTLNLGDGQTSSTYKVSRGKSILFDVYPIQRELQLLEDSLLLNRLTRSSLIRLLEIEVGDMPKKEANDFLRRFKQLIEQHVSMDVSEKGTGKYQSYNAPGPIDNVVYIPVRNGKGHVDINNLGGDVNIRDIADVDYFNNKRAGALKIPRSYLGDDMDGSGLSNGGSLVQLSIRYARTIKRLQTAYIRAITTLLNLFFIDKGLDYVNKFQVRMASPSTQEDLQRNELINGNIDLISSIMSLMESLSGGTQKDILEYLVSNILKMPEVADFVSKDKTPEDEIDIDGMMSSPPKSTPSGGGVTDITKEFSSAPSTPSSDEDSEPSSGFTDQEYSEFEDEL